MVLVNVKEENVFAHLVTMVILVKTPTTCVHLKIAMDTVLVISLYVCVKMAGKEVAVKQKLNLAQIVAQIMEYAIL